MRLVFSLKCTSQDDKFENGQCKLQTDLGTRFTCNFQYFRPPSFFIYWSVFGIVIVVVAVVVYAYNIRCRQFTIQHRRLGTIRGRKRISSHTPTRLPFPETPPGTPCYLLFLLLSGHVGMMLFATVVVVTMVKLFLRFSFVVQNPDRVHYPNHYRTGILI